mgnify:CR=1 FL=1
MKNVSLFGYGKMGSSIAKGGLLKKLNFLGSPINRIDISMTKNEIALSS